MPGRITPPLLLSALKPSPPTRDIRLGLDRIQAFLLRDRQPWNGIHVAGTNGKGTICTLLSRMLTHARTHHGLFTSPALKPDGCRGIQIDGAAPEPGLYRRQLRNLRRQCREMMASSSSSRKRSDVGGGGGGGGDAGCLSPFEFDTALAFRVFGAAAVEYGVVEVGMGGESDATNVMRHKAVTVISKVGLDHQEYLGDTIEKIARVKAGIMRPNVPCIIDHTNSADVLRVLTDHAQGIGAPYKLTDESTDLLNPIDNRKFQLENYEKQNLLCALLAFKTCFPAKTINLDDFLAAEPFPAGRKDTVSVRNLTDGSRRSPVVVDGAHNVLGAQELARHVDDKLRRADEPVTWVIGISASKSKSAEELIRTLVRPQDRIAYAAYCPRDNEPPPVSAAAGRDIALAVVSRSEDVYQGSEPGIEDALLWACERAGPDGPIVVTGSMYLLRDMYLLKGVEGR